jgi:hypothetical protein
MTYVRSVALFVVGAVVMVALQPWTPTGWWLNSAWGVTVTFLVLFGVAVATVRAVDAAIALWIGTAVGMAVVLFRSGPGTLFPIVLAVGSIGTGAAIVAGFFARAWLRSRSR